MSLIDESLRILKINMKKSSWLLLFTLIIFSSCHAPKELIYQDVAHFSIKQEGIDKTHISVGIRLYNPNWYGMKLKKSDVDVFINNNLIGKLNTSDRVKIPARDTFLLPVSLNVSLTKVLPSAVQLLFNSEVKVKLQGNLKAGRNGIFVTIPVSYEGTQDILSGIR